MQNTCVGSTCFTGSRFVHKTTIFVSYTVSICRHALTYSITKIEIHKLHKMRIWFTYVAVKLEYLIEGVCCKTWICFHCLISSKVDSDMLPVDFWWTFCIIRKSDIRDELRLHNVKSKCHAIEVIIRRVWLRRLLVCLFCYVSWEQQTFK